MKEGDLASRFLSSLERETVKVLGAAALIKPVLDRIGIAEIVNGYVSNRQEISLGDVIEIFNHRNAVQKEMGENDCETGVS